MKPLLFIVLMVWGGITAAQHPWPREKSLFVGWTQHSYVRSGHAPYQQLPDWQKTFRVPTLSIERSLRRYGSVILGFGINAFSRPRDPEFRKFNTQVFAELRYYLLLRRHRPTSGFYIGLYGDIDRIKWIYREGRGEAVRTAWENAGPTIGYQHAIGPHFRFNEGVMAVLQSNVRTQMIDATTRNHHLEIVYDAWYAHYWYFKVGYVF